MLPFPLKSNDGSKRHSISLKNVSLNSRIQVQSKERHGGASKKVMKVVNKHRNNFPSQVCKEVTMALHQTMADLSGILEHIRRARPAVRGTVLFRLDDFAGQIMGHIDRVTARARTLGSPIHGAANKDTGHVNFSCNSSSLNGLSCGLDELAQFHNVVSQNVRQGVKQLNEAQDFSSADMLADILRTFDSYGPSWATRRSGETRRNRQPLFI